MPKPLARELLTVYVQVISQPSTYQYQQYTPGNFTVSISGRSLQASPLFPGFAKWHSHVSLNAGSLLGDLKQRQRLRAVLLEPAATTP